MTFEGADWRLLVSRIRDYAIFMLDPTGHVLTWNDGAERIKGYTAREIVGQDMCVFYAPEDIAAKRPQRLLAAARKDGRVEDEGWRVRKDGTRFWADVVITALYDEGGTLRGYGKVTRDLTERKQAEIELAELSGKLLSVQDEERRRIASELHDTTSPLLTSLVAKLYIARQRAAGQDPGLVRTVDDSLSLAEATSNMVRVISSLLHPPQLEEVGLLETLKWFLDSFSTRTAMKLESHLPESMPRLPCEQEEALYHMAQEWLTNLRRSGVQQAMVRLLIEKDRLSFTIQARGAMSADAQAGARPGFGKVGVVLSANRERLRQLGGRLDSDPESMTITATLPVRGRTRSSKDTGL